MSFWKALFGRSEAAAPVPGPSVTEEYNGHTIEAAPYPEEGQFQVAGVISRLVDGERKVHRFVRADRFPSHDEACRFALIKARQIIDLGGDTLFE